MLSYLLPLLLLSTIIIFIFLPVQLALTYSKTGKKEKIKIQLKILFFKFVTIKPKPLIKIISLMARKDLNYGEINEAWEEDNFPQKNILLIIQRLKTWLPKINKIIVEGNRLTGNVLKPIQCENFALNTEIGCQDAFVTALAAGSIWGGYSYLLAKVSKLMFIKPGALSLKVKPNYTKQTLSFDYRCIIRFPLGHIIIILYELVRLLRI